MVIQFTVQSPQRTALNTRCDGQDEGRQPTRPVLGARETRLPRPRVEQPRTPTQLGRLPSGITRGGSL